MAQASQLRETVLSFLDARSCVEQHAANLRTQDTEVVELLHSAGRVLATDILADRDFPPFPRATRDGYAVRAADVAKVPATLSVVGQVKAGDSFNQEVATGECVEIMTRAPVPTGTDAVVMVEYTSQTGTTVEIARSVTSGENVVAAGSEARAGQLLLPTGMRMDYAAIAVAAAVGAATVRVFQRPRVAILSTGDEIVELTELPGPSQIRNSHS